MSDSTRTKSAGGCRAAGTFQTTHWSLILAAKSSDSKVAAEALNELCAAYWYPLFVFVRRRTSSSHDAEDLVQAFFAHLVEKRLIGMIDPEGGRFRSYLLAAFQNFIAGEWRHAHAQKRGGNRVVVSIDDTAEMRYQAELSNSEATPETLFEQQWAWTVLNRVSSQLQEEYTKAGKLELLQELKSHLPGGGDPTSYAEIGRRLRMTESALRMAAHRLRCRYGQLLRSEVAQTVSSPAEIDPEIRHLISVVRPR
jgi:RNA polymerase sigma factor (sigma-70 family)